MFTFLQFKKFQVCSLHIYRIKWSIKSKGFCRTESQWLLSLQIKHGIGLGNSYTTLSAWG